MKSTQHKRRIRDDAARPRLSVLTTPAPTTASTWQRPEPETHELRLSSEERIRKLLPLELTPFDEAARRALA